jgi:hypothetical protein
LIHQDAGKLTPLPRPGAVSEEEALPVDLALGMRDKFEPLSGTA